MVGNTRFFFSDFSIDETRCHASIKDVLLQRKGILIVPIEKKKTTGGVNYTQTLGMVLSVCVTTVVDSSYLNASESQTFMYLKTNKPTALMSKTRIRASTGHIIKTFDFV